MSQEDIDREFPSLSRDDYVKTSDADESYNCIAWAIEDGKKDNWWSPLRSNGYYWPPEVPRGVTVEAFVKLFEIICGYKKCENGDFETGFEKLVIYAHEDDEFSHVARQIEGNVWTSKLGGYDDISHASEFVLEADYAKVKQYLKRKIKYAQP